MMCVSIKGMCTFINVTYIERTTWQGKRQRQRKLQRQGRSPRRRAPRRRNNRRELPTALLAAVSASQALWRTMLMTRLELCLAERHGDKYGDWPHVQPAGLPTTAVHGSSF